MIKTQCHVDLIDAALYVLSLLDGRWDSMQRFSEQMGGISVGKARKVITELKSFGVVSNSNILLEDFRNLTWAQIEEMIEG